MVEGKRNASRHRPGKASADRLAAALKANLKRRKAQARAQTAAEREATVDKPADPHKTDKI
jgi:hypothetical protein